MVYYKNASIQAFKDATPVDDRIRAPRVLAVGEIRHFNGRDAVADEDAGIGFTAFADLTPDMLEEMDPDFILSPTWCNTFDCIDLATLLTDCGFRGRYRAVAHQIPNPAIIRNEVRAACPDLDFDFIDTEQIPYGRLS